MKILVFEDDNQKFEKFDAEIGLIGDGGIRIRRAKNVAEGVSLLNSKFDLVIIDLFLPYLDGSEPVDVTVELTSLIERNSTIDTPIMVITAFAQEATCHEDFLARRGVYIFDFSKTDIWREAIALFVRKSVNRHKYDFIIIVALEKERVAFASIAGITVKSVIRGGLDFWDISFSGYHGCVVKLPRVGLVSASVATSRVLENYEAPIVCMSGICGGVGDGVGLGQLLLTDLCFKYQSGKWFDDLFSAEPYQEQIEEEVRLRLSKYLENKQISTIFESGFSGGDRPPQPLEPKLAIFASGSAVIASNKRLIAIRKQHRKVEGIDMEIYGFHLAARSIAKNSTIFSAKVVVDKANSDKGDTLHSYGCYVSAKATLALIDHFLKDRSAS